MGRLVKLSRQAFLNLMTDHPQVAVQLLFAIIRFIEARLRNMNNKYVDSMLLASFWNRRPATPRASTR